MPSVALPTATAQRSPSATDRLIEQIAECRFDPLRHVELSYPWGEEGTILEHEKGPRAWQRKFLIQVGQDCRARNFNGHDSVLPVRGAVCSGHDVGKSALTAWLIKWIMDTRPSCHGRVTAGTSAQLKTCTWPELQKWNALSLTRDWYRVTTLRIEKVDRPDQHFCVGLTSRKENAGSFAGQHQKHSTSFYIFDESSEVADEVRDVSEGGLTDGEPMAFAFGNPLRATGWFYDIWHGPMRDLWVNKVQIDARTVEGSSNTLHEHWVKAYGEDSDFVRVKVRGEFPRSSVLQFIDLERVTMAQKRRLRRDQYEYAPRVLGVDIARFGDDQTAICRRQGLLCHSILTYREIDTPTCAGLIVDAIREWNPVATFVDKGNFGASVVDMLRKLGHDVIAVDSSIKLQGRECNRRAQMWSRMKEWLEDGQIPEDEELKADLTGPQYGYDLHDRVILESKEDMRTRHVHSPDKGDSLAFTFATDVYKPHPYRQMEELSRRIREDPSLLIGVGAARHEQAMCRNDFDPFGN